MLQLRPWALQHEDSAITLGCLSESPGMPAGASPRMLGDLSQPGGEQSFPDPKGTFEALAGLHCSGVVGDMYVWACSLVPMFLL